MKTSSRENCVGIQESTVTPASFNRCGGSLLLFVIFRHKVQMVAKQRDARSAELLFQTCAGLDRLVRSISESDPFMLAFTSLGEPCAIISPATMKPKLLHCSASSR